MKTILLVDDEPEILELVKVRLEANAYQVLTASDGVEAFAICQDRVPDLIILDVCMPTMDGHKFIHEIKWIEALKNIPILILSARSHMQDTFSEEGIDHFVHKPFDANELLAMVDNCLKVAESTLQKKILVVDDEEEVVDLLTNRLEVNGYQVVKAFDGEMALAQTKAELPDAIILDVVMPNIDGYNTCQIIKSNPDLKDIPVIMLTSLSTKADRRLAAEVKADAHLTKPFDVKNLLIAVDDLSRK